MGQEEKKPDCFTVERTVAVWLQVCERSIYSLGLPISEILRVGSDRPPVMEEYK
jgi:hypothetical protein